MQEAFLSEMSGACKEAMLVIVLIVIITIVLLIGMDRISGRQTTDGRSRNAADDRMLNRFLHRRSQRRPAAEAPQPSPAPNTSEPPQNPSVT